MSRKIFRLRIFKFLSRKYKYLHFPTAIQLEWLLEMGGGRSPLHVAYKGTQPELP